MFEATKEAGQNKKRLGALREAIGYVENGSATYITIGLDDATKNYTLTSPEGLFLFSHSLSDLLDKLIETQKDDNE